MSPRRCIKFGIDFVTHKVRWPGHCPGHFCFRTCKSARVFYRPRVGRLPTLPALEIRGRAERQGSVWTHAPRRLATSRLVEAARNASPPNQWRPARGVCEVCSASVSVEDPFVRCARYRRHDAPPADPGHSAWHALTSMQIGLPGRQGVLACGLHAGLDAAWTAGGEFCVASPTPPTGHRVPPQHLEC